MLSMGTLRREISTHLSIKKGYENVPMVNRLDENSAASSKSAARELMADSRFVSQVARQNLRSGTFLAAFQKEERFRN